MNLASFDKQIFYVNAFSLLFCIVSRAPTMVSEISFLGFKLSINAGYVVVFGIPMLFFSVIWLWIARDRSVQSKRPYKNNKWLLPASLGCISVLHIFLFIQYATEFSPTVNECNQFARIRLWYDWSLYGTQPDYCFSLTKEVQDLMPYIYPPVQTWIYVTMSVSVVAVCVMLARYIAAQQGATADR